MGYGGGGVPCLVNHTFYSCDYSCALFLASVQESNKGKSFQHTNLDTGAFLGQGTSEKIYIGKIQNETFLRRPKCAGRRQNVLETDKTKLPEVESFFAKVSAIFANFPEF